MLSISRQNPYIRTQNYYIPQPQETSYNLGDEESVMCIYLLVFNPSHTAIKILINATAAEFICKNIFPTPVQVKTIIKNKIGDIQQIYLYQNVCK